MRLVGLIEYIMCLVVSRKRRLIVAVPSAFCDAESVESGKKNAIRIVHPPEIAPSSAWFRRLFFRIFCHPFQNYMQLI